MDYEKPAMALHRKLKGKLEIRSKGRLSKKNLSLLYTPGVAYPCMDIAKDPAQADLLTGRLNSVAVITDGSAILGLGNIGPLAGLPVMEGKAILFKELAGINAVPLSIQTGSVEESVAVIRALAPSFGAINLEDFAAPGCFELESALQDLGIPVVHDDQHATAIVVLAGLLNACKLTKRKLSDCRVVVCGCGAAGTAVIKLLLSDPTLAPRQVIPFDREGALQAGQIYLSAHKNELARITGNRFSGTLSEALAGSDIFIGLSKGGLVGEKDIAGMNAQAIVFALANPFPEITPEKAHAGGAVIVATGRSDYPNQINNVLVFPGLFKGLLESHVKHLSMKTKLAAARALAGSIKPSLKKILPHPLDKGYVKRIADAVKKSGAE